MNSLQPDVLVAMQISGRNMEKVVGIDGLFLVVLHLFVLLTCSEERLPGSWLKDCLSRGVRYSANGWDRATMRSHSKDWDS